ncbi:MAG: MarR family transcriptional regulator [Chloroflexota bacterium]|nr:MAG: MarR family transcriptional regulator [Chloroflexota bacterium]
MKQVLSMSNRQPSVLAWLHLLRVQHQIQKCEIAHLAKYNLTLPQFDVLAQLSREEGITQQVLANRLLVTKGNVCGLMERMLEQGLVERRQDPHDGRAYMLHLTAKGKRLIQEILPAHSQLIAAQMNALDSQKQKQLLDLLGELDRALENKEG